MLRSMFAPGMGRTSLSEHAKLARPFDEEVGAAMTQQRAKKPPNEPLKWRVTQNFAELNKITQIPPMFQGDIRAKQQ